MKEDSVEDPECRCVIFLTKGLGVDGEIVMVLRFFPLTS